MKKLLYILFLFPVLALGQTDTINYIKTLNYRLESTTSNEASAMVSVTYFDGLGRPIQQVESKASPLGKDIVRHIEYDKYGRESRQYLPYTSSLNTMLYDAGALAKTNTQYNNAAYELTTNPYTEQFFEASPLNRVLKQGAPGTLWKGNPNPTIETDHTVKTAYKFNTVADNVRRFIITFANAEVFEKPELSTTGYYLSNQLYKTITKDENWTVYDGKSKTTEIYTDKLGKMILKRVYGKDTNNANLPHDTYYVYDKYDNLTYVIPPLASDKIVTSVPFWSFPSTNYPWTNVVQVTSTLQSAYTSAISSYPNSDILNVPLLSTYGGEGGFSVVSNEQGGLSLAINITTSTAMAYRIGKIIDLDAIGNFPDGELGRITGSGYSYIFSVKDNAIQVTGSGKVPSTVQILNGLQPLEYNNNFPWTSVCISDATVAKKYDSDIKNIPNNQILTVYTANTYGAKGGVNINVASDNTVSLSMNITSTTDMTLLKGKTFTMPLQRAVPDMNLGTATGPTYSYTFEIISNALVISGSGKAKNFIFYLSRRPLVKYNIDENAERMCYIYHYDYKDNVVEKQIPDNGWTYIVYDSDNGPIFTQDENQRNTGTWTGTVYTSKDRVAYQGYYQNADTREAIQSSLVALFPTAYRGGPFTSNGMNIYYDNMRTPLTDIFLVNYYEDYAPFSAASMVPPAFNKVGTDIITKPRGQLSGTNVKVLGQNLWTTTVFGYDEKQRLVYSRSKNAFLGTEDLIETQVNFTGSPIRKLFTQTKAGVTTKIGDTYSYDTRMRLKEHYQGPGPLWGWDLATSNLIANNTYDELGRLTNKKVGNYTSSQPFQNIQYKYNIRGWLKSINNPTALGTSLFAFTIDYTGLYNGNISATSWNSITNTPVKKYNYTYDALNRLTNAIYTNPSIATQKYDEKGITYDKNGNLVTLTRMGNTGGSTYNTIDQLAYITKPYSNQLLKVSDTAPAPSFGFINGTNSTDDYDYDDSGNMKKDLNKGIGTSSAYEITYNHLNLPNSIIKDGTHRIDYIYNADGTKLEKKVTNGSVVDKTHYANGLVYLNGIFQYYPHEEGYARKETDGTFTYIYQYKDHLGNVRLSYADANHDYTISTSEIIEETAYYPFGMAHIIPSSAVLSSNPGQKIKYQGQERQDELGLNWDSFKYRNYDYAIGRFMSVDPLAEDYVHNGVYNFAENKVIDHRELEGLEGVWFGLLGTNNSPPATTTMMNTARATIEVGTKTSEAVEVHHIIPRALKNNEVVKNAREEGVKFEGAENKMPLPKFSKASGTGRHGPHPEYNKGMNEAMKKPEGMSAVEFLREVVSQTKDLIQSKPDTKINDIFKTEVIIESTGVPKPELPRRITPKKEEKPKPSNNMEGTTFI